VKTSNERSLQRLRDELRQRAAALALLIEAQILTGLPAIRELNDEYARRAGKPPLDLDGILVAAVDRGCHRGHRRE
jgi:hypothetical protein